MTKRFSTFYVTADSHIAATHHIRHFHEIIAQIRYPFFKSY